MHFNPSKKTNKMNKHLGQPQNNFKTVKILKLDLK